MLCVGACVVLVWALALGVGEGPVFSLRAPTHENLPFGETCEKKKLYPDNFAHSHNTHTQASLESLFCMFA